MPHALLRQEVELRITRYTIEVLAKGKRVASHPRSYRKGHFETLPEHMPAAHCAHAEWSPGKLLTWAASVGPSTAELTKRKVIVRPMAGFGLPDYVRVSVGKAEENAQFLAALAEALAVLA